MAGHAFWEDDLLEDPDVCSKVEHHGHGYFERCPGRAVAWYRSGEEYLSRCDSHLSGDPHLARVERDEVVTALIMRS